MTDTRKIDTLLAYYGTSHQHPQNAFIHIIAIPLIMLSLCGLLYAAHPMVLYVFLAASFVYYARLSAVFLIAMLIFSVFMLWVRLAPYLFWPNCSPNWGSSGRTIP